MKKKSLIAIVMGSDFDLPIMQEAAAILDTFEIDYDISIVSAHRTPEQLYKFAHDAKKKGYRVIIAGAGGSAHLPGMIAAISSLPVIGVPIKTSTLNGVDSLYSIVQMPAGVPVATVAINGAKNAGILAAQILATGDQKLMKKIQQYKNNLRETVLKKSHSLEQSGYKKYLQK